MRGRFPTNGVFGLSLTARLHISLFITYYVEQAEVCMRLRFFTLHKADICVVQVGRASRNTGIRLYNGIYLRLSHEQGLSFLAKRFQGLEPIATPSPDSATQ